MKPQERYAQAQQSDESTGFLQCIHADAEVHAYVEQVTLRTVSENVPSESTDECIAHVSTEDEALPENPAITQNFLTSQHPPTEMDLSHPGENPSSCVGIEPYQRDAQHHTDMNKSNNNAAASSLNKLIFGLLNFDLFAFSEQVAPSVVNLSSHVLTQPQKSLLEKGLNFCPTPGEPDMLE